MHIAYLCPSPTFGMHQYTADLANRMASRGHRSALITKCRSTSGVKWARGT
jgi:hypothetical protein